MEGVLRPELPHPLPQNSGFREVRCVDLAGTGTESVVLVDTSLVAPDSIRLDIARDVQRNALIQTMRQRRADAAEARRAYEESVSPPLELKAERPRELVPSADAPGFNELSDGLARTETTVAEFRAFANATGYVTEAEHPNSMVRCGGDSKARNWRSPGFPSGDAWPVVCVSAADARAYAAWRASIEGRIVRLPTAEELLTTLGPEGTHFWGVAMENVCAFANLASRPISYLPDARICEDPYDHLAPVRSFRPDALGRFDLAGNAAELTSTCLSEASGTGDGFPMNQISCRVWRVVGGSYESAPEVLNPTHPVALETAHLVWDEASPATGFRVFREPKP